MMYEDAILTPILELLDGSDTENESPWAPDCRTALLPPPTPLCRSHSTVLAWKRGHAGACLTVSAARQRVAADCR